MEIRQNMPDRLREWRKRHLVTDSETHEIICIILSLSGMTDTQALPGGPGSIRIT